MRSPVARSGFLMMVLVVLGVSGCGRAKTEDAYVTLLYGDEFLLGVRVLGKSIRDTGSTKDMVVLVSDGVSEYAKKLLDVLKCSARHSGNAKQDWSNQGALGRAMEALGNHMYVWTLLTQEALFSASQIKPINLFTITHA